VAEWTNRSVIALAGDRDPIAQVTAQARSLVLDAMEEGWNGPPYDPFALADILGIATVASDDVPDARVGHRSGQFIVEYNPNRQRARIRFSIAHEIGHTLFPDCADLVRSRVALVQAERDEWQLELLCNLAAAEFLMPIGALSELRHQIMTMDAVLEMQHRFEVSTEAILLRVAKLTEDSAAAFAASQRVEGSDQPTYSIDYFSPSKSFPHRVPTYTSIRESIMAQCTAIGVTTRGREQWPGVPRDLWVECIGVPPYPGHVYPRVVGFVRDADPSDLLTASTGIRYLEGDALRPSEPGAKVVAFVVNDTARKWGGGFALEVRKHWPQVQTSFEQEGHLQLGSIHVSNVSADTAVVSMVAQHGYRRGPKPGIRYKALDTSLRSLADLAIEQSASVHMPRIGAGQAGGDWQIISELIEDNLVQRGIKVTVYVRPDAKLGPQQLGLGLTRSIPASPHKD